MFTKSRLRAGAVLQVMMIGAVVINSGLSKTNTATATMTPATRITSQPIAILPSTRYKGRHADWVGKLLDRAGTWQCPASPDDRGTPPKVKAEQCQRDAYVAAAVLYAWAAECYANQSENDKAEAAADQMYENLKQAQGLCSNAPTFGGASSCDTESVYRCGEL